MAADFNLAMSFMGLSFFLLFFGLVVSSVQAAKNPVVRIIFVNSQSDADKILAEISKGASFAILAKERSVDEKSRERYGEIETAAFESLEGPLKEAALRLQDGEVSEVISLGGSRYALVLAVDMKYYREGARAFRAGDFRKAGINFLKHIEINPDAVKARVRLGQIQEAAKEPGRAEANYRDALTVDPLCEEAYERLGDLYLRLGQFQQAKDIYDKGLSSIPDSKALKAGIGKMNIQLSRVRSRPSKDVPPGGEITKGPTPDSKSPEVENPKADTPGLNMPRGEASKGDPPGKGTPGSPQDKKIHLRIIVTNNEAEAEDVLSQVKRGTSFALLAKERSTDENTSQAYGYLGEVSIDSLDPPLREPSLVLKEGQTSGVIRMGQDRYALLQITDMSLYREGEKAFVSGDFKTAEEKLLRYIGANPDAVKARTIAGKIYEDKKEFSKAIEMYKKAILFGPKTVLAYERLARIYLLLGEYRRARDVYIDGLKQIPSSPVLEEGVEITDILLIGDGEMMP